MPSFCALPSPSFKVRVAVVGTVNDVMCNPQKKGLHYFSKKNPGHFESDEQGIKGDIKNPPAARSKRRRRSERRRRDPSGGGWRRRAARARPCAPHCASATLRLCGCSHAGRSKGAEGEAVGEMQAMMTARVPPVVARGRACARRRRRRRRPRRPSLGLFFFVRQRAARSRAPQRGRARARACAAARGARSGTASALLDWDGRSTLCAARPGLRGLRGDRRAGRGRARCVRARVRVGGGPLPPSESHLDRVPAAGTGLRGRRRRARVGAAVAGEFARVRTRERERDASRSVECGLRSAPARGAEHAPVAAS